MKKQISGGGGYGRQTPSACPNRMKLLWNTSVVKPSPDAFYTVHATSRQRETCHKDAVSVQRPSSQKNQAVTKKRSFNFNKIDAAGLG